MNVLLLGLNKSWAEILSENENINFYVIEEPELWVNKKLSVTDFPNVKEVKLLKYQFKNENEMDEIIYYAKKIKADVIIPGLEYSVAPASYVASLLNLPNLGILAAKTLTNKYSLRKKIGNTKIAQPRYKKVGNMEAVKEFFEGPIIIKPTNRQASAGVIKVFNKKDIPFSWKHALGVDEGVNVTEREIEVDFLVEELLIGQEVSVEVLVNKGKIQFFNITVKETSDGKFPVEIGHYVPGDFPNKIKTNLRQNMEILISELDVQTGILHAEWIIVNDAPYLIECAGRAPGDYIFQLIKMAYGFCPYSAMLDIFLSKTTKINQQEERGVAIAFLSANENGYLKSLKGFDELNCKPEVLRTGMFAEVGDKVNTLHSSWDRLGMIICSGTSGKEAFENTQINKENIKIKIENFGSN